LPAIFNTTTRKDRIRRSATKRLTRCIIKNKFWVARARAHGGSPVLLPACGCRTIVGSEQEVTYLCQQTSCQESIYFGRLQDQQPFLLLMKEQKNGEANNFYLKSCPAHWVHLSSGLSSASMLVFVMLHLIGCQEYKRKRAGFSLMTNLRIAPHSLEFRQSVML
jgi:hypothetical protein